MLGLGCLARYGTYQKTISGGPEQKYLSSDPRLEWPAEGHYSSLHAFTSFKLPILTDKSLNIAFSIFFSFGAMLFIVNQLIKADSTVICMFEHEPFSLKNCRFGRYLMLIG